MTDRFENNLVPNSWEGDPAPSLTVEVELFMLVWPLEVVMGNLAELPERGGSIGDVAAVDGPDWG